MSNIGNPALAVIDGDFWCFYRDGPGHNPSSGKGTIKYKTSSDGGASWSSATTLISDATYDCRDPSALVLADGTVLVAFKKSDTATNLPVSVHVYRSTNNGSSWSEITLTNNFTSFPTSGGNMVELANGDVLAPVYGKDTGDTYFSARVSISTDSGATWSHLAEIADGESDARDYNEPSLVVLSNGTTVAAMIRSNTDDQFRWSTSTDSGATWSAVASVGWNDQPSAKPDVFCSSNGTIICVYRGKEALWNGRFRMSVDDGVSWSPPGAVSARLGNSSSAFHWYSQMVQSGDDVAIAYAFQNSDTSGDVFFTYWGDVIG